MKKLILMMTMVLVVMLCACGGENTKTIEGEVAATTDNTQTTEEVTEEKAGESTVSYKGYAYIHNDVVIEIDAQAAPIIEQLGDAISYFEAPSCAFEGIDKIYTYTSFEIDTYPLEGVDYVSGVTFKDDSITTPEGIAIGDSIDKVKEVYGSEFAEENGMIVYEKDDMKLCFIVADDAVVSIEYASTILDE